MHNPPLILIADDDPAFREIIATKLKNSGFLVAEARDGKEAFDRAKNLLPDLLLLDVQMPNMNGTETILDLKHDPETKNLKIIFLTSMDNPWPAVKKEVQKVAQALGALQYINKAEDLDKALTTVKSALSDTHGAA